MTQIVDSYSESNQDRNETIDGVVGDGNDYDFNQFGQSFTGDGGTLNSAKFYLKKVNSPTGNATAKIYAHSGTFGTSSIPTGVALATSDNFDVSSLTTSYQLITFTFSGSEKITLTNGTKYIVVCYYNSGNYVDYIFIGSDGSSSTHSGNICYFDYLSIWHYTSANDLCFYVYKDDPPLLRMGFINHQNPGIV